MLLRRERGGLPALGLAVGGVLLAHWLTYLVVRPDVHGRTELLASTGHGYLGVAVQAAVLVTLGAGASAFLVGLTRGQRPMPRLAPLAVELWAFQLVAFLVLETIERAAAGSFEGLGAVALVGATMQLVVAVVAAWILRFVDAAADRAVAIAHGLRLGFAPVRLNRAPHPIPERMSALLANPVRGPPRSL